MVLRLSEDFSSSDEMNAQPASTPNVNGSGTPNDPSNKAAAMEEHQSPMKLNDISDSDSQASESTNHTQASLLIKAAKDGFEKQSSSESTNYL